MSEWSGVAGKRVLITGATSGIGLAAAKELSRRGALLSIVARSEQRGQRALAEIGAGASADLVIADLSLQRSIRELASELLARYERVDVLINNAGAMFSRRELTSEGFERTWALNHLGPFLLTTLLLDRLRESAPARVITTSSDAHRGVRRLPFDDLDAANSYRRLGFARYSETKLANILFTAELARRLEGSGVGAYCLHPGLVASGFNRNNGPMMDSAMRLLRPFSRTPERGAQTLVWLADTSETLADGGYYVDERLRKLSPAALDMQAAARLWELSEQQTDVADARTEQQRARPRDLDAS